MCINGGKVLTTEELQSGLMMNDYPGAIVKLIVAREMQEDAGPEEVELTLTKMDASFIADRCQVFSAFAALKVR